MSPTFDPARLLSRLVEIVYHGKANPLELALMAKAEGLADWLRDAAQRKLA